MYFDPLYMVVMAIGAALAYFPQMWVKQAYQSVLQVPSSRGASGRQVAEELLRAHGAGDVVVEPVEGELSDHYDPRAKAVRLSRHNYDGSSVAAIAIAAHEVGHAIQHNTGYSPLVLRASLAPVAGIGSQFGGIVLMASLALAGTGTIMPDFALSIAWLGVAMFGAGVLFHVVTLPVEFNASLRAIRILESGHYLTTSEFPHAKKVLTAAAMTYVAVALNTLIQLMYWVFRIMSVQQRR